MWNVSTGCEPWFNLHYTRNTKSLEHGEDKSFEVWAPIAKEANERNWHPETLVTANDITWKQHIDIQAAFQNGCDTAISKTINLSRKTTVDDIKELYMYAWKKGLKGCTIYVDGSRDPILTTASTSSSKEKEPIVEANNSVVLDSIIPITRADLGEVLTGDTYKNKTACGTLYTTINKDENGNIVEIFTNSSKNGTCKANLNGETRLASLALRAGVKIEEVVDSLRNIQCQSCAYARAKGNQIDGTSCPDVIAKCLLKSVKHVSEPKEKLVVHETKHEVSEATGERCPECGASLDHTGGCKTCPSCGYSRCE